MLFQTGDFCVLVCYCSTLFYSALMSGCYSCKLERGNICSIYLMSEVCFSNSFQLLSVVIILCLPEVCSVLEESADCVLAGAPSTRALHTGCRCGGCLGPFIPHDGCQFTVLAVPKDPNNFLGDFKVPLVIYNESVPLFLQFRSSTGSFPSPWFLLLFL